MTVSFDMLHKMFRFVIFVVINLSMANAVPPESALTVNDPLQTEQRPERDLDESVPPDQPSVLKTKTSSREVTIFLPEPRDNRILVRGYTIGWGKGVPDEMTITVDDKQRFFVVRNLKPNNEYVISLRAYNNVGKGRPIYETVHTRDEEEPATPLEPPVGLKAIVLSSLTVVLAWDDPSFPRNHRIPDNRYYTVRYTLKKSKPVPEPRYQYRNSTNTNIMLDNLKPNTKYEFTVKIVQGKRQSPWSPVVVNKTKESAPSSPPRDLEIHSVDSTNDHQFSSIELSWRPPKNQNGKVNGYLIQYTTDRNTLEHDWLVEDVVGDVNTTTIHKLLPDTKYFFQLRARNNMGYGPPGLLVTYTTSKVVPSFVSIPESAKQETNKNYSKVAIAQGFDGTILHYDIEVIDLLSPNRKCVNLPVFPFPNQYALGGLGIGDNPIICGGETNGSQCISLQNGTWKPDVPPNHSLSAAAISGSPFPNDGSKLFVTGGFVNYRRSKASEVLTENGWELSTPMPEDFTNHCMVQIDSSTIIVIGGYQTVEGETDHTFLFNGITKVWSEGPRIKKRRTMHSCAMIWQDSLKQSKSVIVVGGTSVWSDNQDSTEVLDVGSTEWRFGPKLPFGIKGAGIVNDPSGGVVLIGGWGDEGYLKTLFRLPHAGSNGVWERLTKELQFSRFSMSTFLIPDEIANCQ